MIASEMKARGLNAALIGDEALALAEFKARGCDVVQLTTDQSRSDAQRFYQKLGFVGSHLGFKIKLA